ncbi:interleukin-8-like [Discoglossus pictus]
METKKNILTFLAVCLTCAVMTEGMSLARVTELRCLCVKTHSSFIHPKHFQTVQLFPKGASCENVEVIVTLKTGSEVCLEPTAPWVQKIINRIFENSKTKKDKQLPKQ